MTYTNTIHDSSIFFIHDTSFLWTHANGTANRLQRITTGPISFISGILSFS